MSKRKPVIAIIGAGDCLQDVKDKAYLAGKTVAELGGVVVCGGLGGVMREAARGAYDAGGTVIGILPSADKMDANPFISYVIPSGMGKARNVIIINTADAIVAFPGSYGTLTEVAFALQMNKPIISVSSWNIDKKIIEINDPVEAVKKAFALIENI